jgi:L-ribulokinase
MAGRATGKKTVRQGYLIGLDYGTLSARGVLIDAVSGRIEASHTHPYRHGVMTEALPGGAALPPGWALQNAPDYTEAAEAILGGLGRGRVVHGLGLGFTASSPLPARADGTPLSVDWPDQPHAYVKLWKHQAAQPWARSAASSRPNGCWPRRRSSPTRRRRSGRGPTGSSRPGTGWCGG